MNTITINNHQNISSLLDNGYCSYEQQLHTLPKSNIQYTINKIKSFLHTNYPKDKLPIIKINNLFIELEYNPKFPILHRDNYRFPSIHRRSLKTKKINVRKSPPHLDIQNN